MQPGWVTGLTQTRPIVKDYYTFPPLGTQFLCNSGGSRGISLTARAAMAYLLSSLASWLGGVLGGEDDHDTDALPIVVAMRPASESLNCIDPITILILVADNGFAADLVACGSLTRDPDQLSYLARVAIGRNERTLLMAACALAHVARVRELCDAGASVEERGGGCCVNERAGG